jgi:hypothetical protein
MLKRFKEDFRKDFNKTFVGRNYKHLLLWLLLNVIAVIVVGVIMHYYCMYNIITK